MQAGLREPQRSHLHSASVDVRCAAVAERLADLGTQTQFEQTAGKGVGIYTGEDGYLYCDSLRIDDIRDKVGVYLVILSSWYLAG